MSSISSINKKFIKQASKIILFVGMVYISACTNNDAERGQFNNNSSGVDQDHTAAPPDTIPVNEAAIGDTLHSVQSSSIDTITKQ